ncbi:hypothetical protein [Pedobacter sp. D749]|uniref:hypothetical protein n=1 Tax=Pedobacter sp. D749 TaxID=2856523 RepID=UPI001C58476D|nr:hypothetical protein [Pedobacter sp. D749]QXU41681.1 hypothetical protein KYH19_22210 [Pedobacter sp. D749]
MSFFKNKSILILSVKFFNYENLIKDELSLMGAKVDLFDERPSNSFYSKAVIRLKKSFYQRKIDQYYRDIIRKVKVNKYDFFLLIKGEVVPIFFLEFLKSNNPGLVFIYYTYDSFKNNPNGLNILSHFERKFTFDRMDAVEHGLSFRPLFFASDYADVKGNNDLLDYDIAFIGTAHSDRYTLSQAIEKLVKSIGLKMFNFYYSPSKILFYFRKLTDKNFRKFDREKISFGSLSHKQIIAVYRKSKAILDINHPGQNGLTMRTFETLGMGKKLITTNKDIKNYPFFSSNNILIIDRDIPNLHIEFFKNDFEKIDQEIYFLMSLRGWLKELFEQESNIWKL